MQVDAEHLVPKLFGNILDRAAGVAFAGRGKKARAGGDAGIGEDHIEAAGRGGDLVEQRAQRCAIGEIGDLAADLAAARRKLRHRALGDGAVAVDDDDVRTIVAHGARHGEAKPIGAAGHHRDFVRYAIEFLGLHAFFLMSTA